MRRLILIKHSYPNIDPALLWHEWRLSEEGRRRCESLADVVAEYEPSAIYCSSEGKAIETAEIVAARIPLPTHQVHELRENDRTGLGIIPAEQIKPLFADFFARPEDIVIGNESACAARDRFGGAIERIVESEPEGDVVVVAHGTVITLFVAAHNAVDSFAFWEKLGLPSMVVLSLLDYRLLGVTSDINLDQG